MHCTLVGWDQTVRTKCTTTSLTLRCGSHFFSAWKATKASLLKGETSSFVPGRATKAWQRKEGERQGRKDEPSCHRTLLVLFFFLQKKSTTRMKKVVVGGGEGGRGEF